MPDTASAEKAAAPITATGRADIPAGVPVGSNADVAAEGTYARAMRRALELAANGPSTGVNPRVGCVILGANGSTIAEGWHRGAGTAHAEVDALAQLPVGGAHGATAVVTLEPCNHTGRTGPCALALVDAGVSRVVYAVSDPGEHSSGGAERLRAAGVAVESGVLAEEATAFLGDWLRATRLGRPFVTLKWAASLDGRAAADDGTSQWITGPAARADVHRRRAAAGAIIVGTGTALADDPALTARDDDGELLPQQPVPVVIGTRSIPHDAALYSHPHAPIFFGREDADDRGGDGGDGNGSDRGDGSGSDRGDGSGNGSGSSSSSSAPHGIDLRSVLEDLQGRGIRRVFVEGGPTLASAFVSAGLVDEYLVYLAPTLLGGSRLALGDIGVDTIGGQRRLRIDSIERLGDDILLIAHPPTPPHQPPTTH